MKKDLWLSFISRCNCIRDLSNLSKIQIKIPIDRVRKCLSSISEYSNDRDQSSTIIKVENSDLVGKKYETGSIWLVSNLITSRYQAAKSLQSQIVRISRYETLSSDQRTCKKPESRRKNVVKPSLTWSNQAIHRRSLSTTRLEPLPRDWQKNTEEKGKRNSPWKAPFLVTNRISTKKSPFSMQFVVTNV